MQQTKTGNHNRPALTSPVWLDHAAIMTADLERAMSFYVDILGLRMQVVENDPLLPERRRALLADAQNRLVLEIIEMTTLGHSAIPGRGAIHHLGFRLSIRDWQSLRTRLDATDHSYQEIDGRVFVRDADGMTLEITHTQGHQL